MFLNHKCPNCNKIYERDCVPNNDGDDLLCDECIDNKCYPKECECLYHVFTDNHDDWVENKSEAYKLAKEILKENDCVRIYKETNWDYEEGLFTDEDCIYSVGSFPW